MADWRIGVGDPDGNSQSASTTRFQAILGGYTEEFTEAPSEIVVRRAFTLSGMYVRILSNATSAASTYRSRVNGANGNQVITIPSGTSGVFEDLVNEDVLASGDIINSQLVSGAGGSVVTSVFDYNLNADADESLIGANGFPVILTADNRFQTIIGAIGNFATEADVQYRMRLASTFQNFQVNIVANTINGATTFRTRIDGVNGNILITVPASTSGIFEDTVNSDTIVSGDLFTYNVVAGGGSGLMTTAGNAIQMSNSRIVGVGRDPSTDINFGLSRFFPMEAIFEETATEVDTQADAGVPFTATNYFVKIRTNTVNGASTVTLRLDGANTALAVTIPASTTGEFEDLVDEITFAASDLIGHLLVTGGSSGAIGPQYIGFQMNQPESAVPPPEQPQPDSAHWAIGRRVVPLAY